MKRGGEGETVCLNGQRSYCLVYMTYIDGDRLTHLSEQQLVDYVQQGMSAYDLQQVNSHLITCQKCAEQLSSLILFAAENQLLRSEQERVLDQFLASADYNLLKNNFISRAIESYKRRRSKSISLKFSFNIRLT